MKSLLLFLQDVLIDLGTLNRTSTTRDFKTITSRVEHEGLSFLTITLSNFGKDFEKSLDQGFVGHDQFLGFSRTGSLPDFLRGFFDLVFDRGTGRLLDDPEVTAIFAIRQVSYLFSKVNLPCTEKRNLAAIDGYIQCEKEVKARDASLKAEFAERFQRLGLVLFGDVLQRVDEDIYYGRLIPKHGPGATADKLKGNLKWSQREWPDRLDKEFPFGDFLLPNQRFHQESDRIDFLEPGRERPVKVILVPKTLKTPRIIAVEPAAMQYSQQAIHVSIQRAIQVDSLVSRTTSYHSQVPNQNLAMKGSYDGSLATLDLSEASDRVSNQHVRLLLHHFPNLFRAVDACRSRKADVPGHGVIRLAKFASMGSALCFPMEAMVFTTVVFMGIEDALKRPLTRKDIKSFHGKVRVYGDDIIVPVEFVQNVVENLEAFGFKVNSNKSFWTGKFRESCGREYYAGEDVSITRVRSLFPTRRSHVHEIVSTVATRNLLYKQGLWRAAAHLDTKLQGLIPWPMVSERSSLLGRQSFLLKEDTYSTARMDPGLHHPLVKGVTVRTVLPISKLEDVDALLKCLVLLEQRNASADHSVLFADQTPDGDYSSLPTTVTRHLERAGRPLTVGLKQRWASPY